MMKKNQSKTVCSLLAGVFTVLLSNNVVLAADLLPVPAPVSNMNTLLILAGVVVLLAVAAVLIIRTIKKRNAK